MTIDMIDVAISFIRNPSDIHPHIKLWYRNPVPAALITLFPLVPCSRATRAMMNEPIAITWALLSLLESMVYDQLTCLLFLLL